MAFAYQGNSGQEMHIKKLAEKGFAGSLLPTDLHPGQFRTKILESFKLTCQNVKIYLNGAVKMSEKITWGVQALNDFGRYLLIT